MSTARLRQRIASATPIAAGYISRYQLAFHKRGQDGSAKANAFRTGCVDDRVWGVVFAISPTYRSRLDEFEQGYDVAQVVVAAEHGEMVASIYVARWDMLDDRLVPFVWYHRLVVQGAREHRLPTDYVRQLESVTTSLDSDAARREEHLRLLE